MKCPAGMAVEPGPHLVVLVGRIGAEDAMNGLAGQMARARALGKRMNS